MSATETYIVEQNEWETRFETAGAVCNFLDRVGADEAVELWVMRDPGRRRGWLQRLVGMSERLILPCFHLQKEGAAAVLTFLDDAWSEYRALDPQQRISVSEAVRMKLSCGEPTPAPPEVCLAPERAFEAAKHYLMQGERPEWLTYRYVK